MTTHEGAEVVRALYRAFEDGDHDRIRDCLADDLRWRQAGSVVPAAGEDAAGADAFLERVILPIEEQWEGFTEEIHQLITEGEHVVATGLYRGTSRCTGRKLVAEFCHLWTVRDGRLDAFRQFTDTAAFAAALGSGLGQPLGEPRESA